MKKAKKATTKKSASKAKASKKAAPKKGLQAKGKSAQPKRASVKKASYQKNSDKYVDGDIIQLILDDHKALKELIKTMKDSDAEMDEKREAFEEFAPLLVRHAKPEEQSLYVFMKDDEEMREEGFEGDVEHGLADQMVEEIKRTEDEDLWSARVKVLAELVEHHIEEEEEELLPDFAKHASADERLDLGQMFLQLKTEIVDQGGVDSPSEKSIQMNAANR